MALAVFLALKRGRFPYVSAQVCSVSGLTGLCVLGVSMGREGPSPRGPARPLSHKGLPWTGASLPPTPPNGLTRE